MNEQYSMWEVLVVLNESEAPAGSLTVVRENETGQTEVELALEGLDLLEFTEVIGKALSVVRDITVMQRASELAQREMQNVADSDDVPF